MEKEEGDTGKTGNLGEKIPEIPVLPPFTTACSLCIFTRLFSFSLVFSAFFTTQIAFFMLFCTVLCFIIMRKLFIFIFFQSISLSRMLSSVLCSLKNVSFNFSASHALHSFCSFRTHTHFPIFWVNYLISILIIIIQTLRSRGSSRSVGRNLKLEISKKVTVPEWAGARDVSDDEAEKKKRDKRKKKKERRKQRNAANACQGEGL